MLFLFFPSFFRSFRSNEHTNHTQGSSHLPLDLLRLALGLPRHLLRLPLCLAHHLGRLALDLARHFLGGALGFLCIEADGRFEGGGCLFCERVEMVSELLM